MNDQLRKDILKNLSEVPMLTIEQLMIKLLNQNPGGFLFSTNADFWKKLLEDNPDIRMNLEELSERKLQ